MVKLRLVCLLCNKKKDGTGMWYKATFKKHNADGKPVVGDIFLPEKVGAEAVAAGLLEDIDVMAEIDLDSFFRPTIVSMTKASKSSVTQTSLGV